MKSAKTGFATKVIVSVLALNTVADATVSMAQSSPASDSRPATAPPVGQYAPPPTGAEAPGSSYEDQAQRFDRDYADRYSRWAVENCVDQRNNNTAAGAVIGGVLGAVLGSNVAGRGAHGAGAVVGGALGATAGAEIGANTGDGAACPPGYMVRAGAPIFAYGGPVYPPAVVYGPSWYQPWVWVDGHWVYRPYRYWYWRNDTYWRPGWRAGPWTYHYRRW
jgi:hypothetical protein